VISTQSDAREGELAQAGRASGRIARAAARGSRTGARAAPAGARPARSRGRVPQDASLGGRRARGAPGRARPGAPAKGVSFQAAALNVSYREINLIGKRAEEACDLVDKFLDDAAMASVDVSASSTVMHGDSQESHRRAAGGQSHVDKFYPAPPAEAARAPRSSN